MAGGARAAGGAEAGVAGAGVADEPLEAAGAWGDDDDVLQDKVCCVRILRAQLKHFRSLFSAEFQVELSGRAET